MSFNRTTYDNCSYKQELQDNVSTLSYLLSPYRYEHENKCRHQLGFVGGTVVSHIQGNLVDLDSELRGQTRIISKCGTTRLLILSIQGFIQWRSVLWVGSISRFQSR